MIDANLKVADEVSDEFVNEVLLQGMEEFMDFGTTYKGAVNRYFLRGRTNVSICNSYCTGALYGALRDP